MDAGAAFVLECRPMSPPAAPVHPVTPLNELARAEAAPSFSPLYRQIKGLILKGLQAGEWKAGEIIPYVVRSEPDARTGAEKIFRKTDPMDLKSRRIGSPSILASVIVS